MLLRYVVWCGRCGAPRGVRLMARGGLGGGSAAVALSIIPRRVKGRDERALRALDPTGSRPACRKAAERMYHTMTRHTTIRRSDVAELLPRGAYTAGVPLTSAQAAVISVLISTELCSRKYGHGQLPVTDEALADEALRAIVQLMDLAVADISVLRVTPQRKKR